MHSTVQQPRATIARTLQGILRGRGLALAGLAVALAAAVSSVQLVLAADFSGTVSLSRLSIPEGPTEAESQAGGASWQHRAQLTCSTGRFSDVGELVLADLRITREVAADGHAHLRVELPRGAAARWPALLTVTATGPRRSALSALDPTGRMNEVGDNLRLRIRAPATVATHGVLPSEDDLTSEADRDEASLVVPLEVALAEGPPLVWTLTWER
jgi:hypothetical protein